MAGNPAVRSSVATALMLIVLGLGLYGIQFLGDTADSIVLLLMGGLGIAAYLYTGAYFLLVVGCIVFGLGIGSFGERNYYLYGEFSEIGLGLGFVLIYLIGLVSRRRSHWWPLIPGTVLLLLGFQAWQRFRLFVFSQKGWPLILVIIGGLMLLGTLGRARRARKLEGKKTPDKSAG